MMRNEDIALFLDDAARKSYINKILGTERANLVGLWDHNEGSGIVSYDKSGKGHHGAYSGGVRFLQPGIGDGGTSVLYAEATTNLVTNPSFETNTTGWLAAGSNTIAQSTERSKEGSNSLKCTHADNTTLVYYEITLTAAAHSTGIWIWIPSSWEGTNVQVDMNGWVGITGTTVISADMAKRDEWQFVAVPDITPDGGDLVGFLRVADYTGLQSAGNYLYIDGAQVEAKAYATPYCDGSLGGNELIDNPSFETAGAGGADIWADWSELVGSGALANETSIVYEGTDAAKLSYVTGGSHVLQNISVTAGVRYRLRFFTRGDGTKQGRYYVKDVTNDTGITPALTNTGVSGTVYTLVSYEFVAPSGCTTVTIDLYSPGSAGDAYFDSVSVGLAATSYGEGFWWEGVRHASISHRTATHNNIYSPGLANDNLLSNPGFETAGGGDPDFWADWTESVGDGALANETTIVHEGTDACKITAGATANTYLGQLFTVVPGKRYRLRFWTRGDGINAGRYHIYDATNSAPIVGWAGTGIVEATYTAFVKEFTAPAGCVSVGVYFYCAGANGGITYFDACEVRSMDGFLGDEGTLLAWAKVSAAGVWEDGVQRYIFFARVDVSNIVGAYRLSGDNTLRFQYSAGGVLRLHDILGSVTTDFAIYCMTWDMSAGATGEVKYFLDGIKIGTTDTGLGTWAGNLASTRFTIGSSSTVPADVWNGPEDIIATWNKALTEDQVANVSKV